jgi:histidine phosphotransferase ChpT
MLPPIDLRVLELLSARLCHELISPIAAVGNGIELLADEEPHFLHEATALVAESSRKASTRLQFYRFALGFRGDTMAGPPPHQLVGEFFAGTRIDCDYSAEARVLSLDWQKLGCNLLALAGDALLRGGHITFGTQAAEIIVEGEGDGIGPPVEIRAALTLATSTADLTTRTVGAYFAGLLAAALSRTIVVAEAAPGRFTMRSALMA